MQTRSDPGGEVLARVIAGLDRYVGAITVRSILTVALRRCGRTMDSLAREGLTAPLIDEMERGLRMYVRIPADLQACRQLLEQLRTRVSIAPPSSFDISIVREQDIVEARSRVRDLAGRLGFNHTDQIRIATAVSEMARNIYSYAGKGTISAGPATNGRVGLWIHATDEGPGIPNIAEILSGSYKSRTGMGLGLLACKQLMDSFSIITAAGMGTRVKMEKYKVSP